MKLHRKLLFLALLLPGTTWGQGQFSGDIQANFRFYQIDSSINACCNELYDNFKRGGESWMSFNYLNNPLDFSVGVRLEFFLNSDNRQPGVAYTGVGVGTFYIQKKFGKLDVLGGYMYEQFGSGLTLRTYEERPQGIDNSLLGIHLKYEIAPNWHITALGGLMRNNFELYQQPVFGADLEGTYNIGDKVLMTTGASALSRTLDQETMSSLVDAINNQPLEERFDPMYNTYAFSLWNQLDVGGWTWYIEGAYKTHESVRVPVGAGDPLGRTGKFIDTDGTILSSSLSYSTKGFGITGQVRRMENFALKTDPFGIGLNGQINFLPTLTRQNTWRLTARYNAVPQNLSENNIQLDLILSPAKGYTLQLNYSDVRDLNMTELYRELYGEIEVRTSKKWKLIAGLQFQQYDQEFYEEKPLAPKVESITPFSEFIWKFDRKKSLRLEAQYLHTLDEKADFGRWTWLLAEFNIAPHWSFSAADMWNIRPAKDPDPSTEKIENPHYPTVFVAYNQGATRLTAAYTNQVEGIVCTGGICRYEPAFSGVRLTLQSSF